MYISDDRSWFLVSKTLKIFLIGSNWLRSQGSRMQNKLWWNYTKIQASLHYGPKTVPKAYL